ncbi:MAG TPA: hypothetical protein VKN16_09600 [Methylomirabilota bacterium]|jgi:hypothetical protein|nr:hypothetical protein [Methylomirabilota bacterium]
MPRRGWLLGLVALVLLAGCVSVTFGRDFPSPESRWIVNGKTDRYGLVRMFGEPYQMGLDNGDTTWRWFYGQRDAGYEVSKDLTVRFNNDWIVKSYSFTSNFPDDLRRLK